MKHILKYAVRSSRAPGESQDTFYPAIIDRNAPTELATLVEKCIDRGLIIGAKANAAQGIAEGIAEQIVREFENGNGVSFGQYFYGRLYLNGTTGSNGTLSDANGVNVRLYKGNDFKLSRNDYTMQFEGAAEAPKVDNVVCEGSGDRNVLVVGEKATINGSNLNFAGDTNKVTFREVDAPSAEPVVVTTFTAAGPSVLTFTVAGLTAGKSYKFDVERTDSNGVKRTATGKTVKVVSGTPAAPDITDTYCGNAEVDHTDIDGNSDFIIEGEHLQDASVTLQYYNDGVWSDPSSPTEESLTRAEGKITVAAAYLSALFGEGGWDLGDTDQVKITVTNSVGSDSVERSMVWAD